MPEPVHPARKYDFDRVVRLLLTCGGALLLFWLVSYLADVLVPFAVALLLAYLLNPIVSALEERLGRRVYAVAITLAGLTVVALSLIVVIVPLVVREVDSFRGVVQQLRDPPAAAPGETAAASQPTSLAERYRAFVHRQPNEWVRRGLAYIPEWVAEIDTQALRANLARRVAPGLWGVLNGLAALIALATALIITGVYLVFLLIDYPNLAQRWRGFLPPAYRDEIVRFLDEFQRAMGRYFRGQVVVASLTGILMAVGFSIIGLRMSIILGLFIGLLAMVPYMQAVGLIPALLLAVVKSLEQNSSAFWSIATVLIVFGVVQLIQDTVLTPRIMGKATGLQPAIILLGVLIWGKLLGFLGLVLAIPLTCLAIAYYQRLVLERRRTDQATG